MKNIEPVAVIHTEFPCKFGIPRQSGLTASQARIVFEEKYRRPEAVSGIEEFSHLWLIWDFSEAHREEFSPTVRPPRLGGNERRGVFATRSPFRPNSLGLSCVRLLSVDYDCPDAPVLIVSGADILDGTPVYDIKPYIPYADSVPAAKGGFAEEKKNEKLEVDYLCEVPEALRGNLTELLSQDPRPHYSDDETRIYSFEFARHHIEFRGGAEKITVLKVVPL